MKIILEIGRDRFGVTTTVSSIRAQTKDKLRVLWVRLRLDNRRLQQPSQ